MILTDRDLPGIVETCSDPPVVGRAIVKVIGNEVVLRAVVREITVDGRLFCEYMSGDMVSFDEKPKFYWEGEYHTLSPYSFVLVNFSTVWIE